MWNHLCVPVMSLPSQASKVGKKLQNSLHTLKHRAKQVPNIYTSVDVLYCKFCQDNVNCKNAATCKDHLQSEKKQGEHHAAHI